MYGPEKAHSMWPICSTSPDEATPRAVSLFSSFESEKLKRRDDEWVAVEEERGVGREGEGE